jgi:hypothetical protein
MTVPKISKALIVSIDNYKCNLACPGCCNETLVNKGIDSKLKYSPKQIREALSIERLGGVSFLFVSSFGETLIPEYTFDIIQELLEEGHYVGIVTNGTLTNRIKCFCELPQDMRERIFFKLSFQYHEFMRLGLLEKFFENVNTIKKNDMSFTIELVGFDYYIPLIEEIKVVCLERVGAYPHITIPRIDDSHAARDLQSKYSIEEFYEIWKSFESELLDMKYSIWGINQKKNFCNAGYYTALINLNNGEMSYCYRSKEKYNIFKRADKEIIDMKIGNNCNCKHCFNGHFFLTFGDIECIKDYSHSDIRNRKCADGTEWLTERMKIFLNQRCTITECGDYTHPSHLTKMRLLFNGLETVVKRKITRVWEERKYALIKSGGELKL